MQKEMKAKQFVPSRKYLTKLWVTLTIFVLLIGLGLTWFVWVIAVDQGSTAVTSGVLVVAILGGIVWFIGMILAVFYYRSLRYEIKDDEVVVHVGIVTKSVKHVPYRTVTNITIRRGLLDRYVFNLGTLGIQTAGMGATSSPEESLVGLENVQDVYGMVVGELHRFRHAMPPTAGAAGEEVVGETAVSSDTLQAILQEVRAIRHAIDQRET